MDEAAALAAFAGPTLGAVRPDLRAAWGASLGDEALGAAVLGNPRLSERVAADILRSAGLGAEGPGPDDLDGADAACLGRLLAHGPLRLAWLAGCAWHRATVLDWLTWRATGERLPDLTRAEILLAAGAAAGLAPETDMPAASDPDLAASEVLTDGFLCLAAWRASLDAPLRERLRVFSAARLPAPDGARGRAAVLRAVVAAQAEAGA